MPLAHKKIVFVIVEGPSDEEALGIFFNKFFDRNRVYVHIIHGDLTTTSGNIRNRIKDEIEGYAKANHFTRKNFQEVIHIIDMDGAFIPDSSIIENKKEHSTYYSVKEIHTSNKESIIGRNIKKRNNIDIISSLQNVWGNIPYQAYYMSCNLEHVLFDKLNCTDEEKEKFSFEFARKYRNDFDGFISFISKSEFSVCGDYLKSWKYIKQGVHSLERHTNLAICLNSGGDFTESE